MKKIYYLLILTLIFVSCKRDCQQSTKDPETVGSTNEKQFLPYKGYEVFKFLKNNSDTINFYGQSLKTEYQYTYTQEGCSQKIPLENKYIKFLDKTIDSNGYLIQLYVTSTFSTNCIMKINDKTIYNNSVSSIPGSPILLDVLGTKYDEIYYIGDSSAGLYYQFSNKGVVKFKYYNNIYELIP